MRIPLVYPCGLQNSNKDDDNGNDDDDNDVSVGNDDIDGAAVISSAYDNDVGSNATDAAFFLNQQPHGTQSRDMWFHAAVAAILLSIVLNEVTVERVFADHRPVYSQV